MLLTAIPVYRIIFLSSEEITPKQHVDVQAAAQKWIDSSISKTANVPTDFPFEEFKDIYMYDVTTILIGKLGWN